MFNKTFHKIGQLRQKLNTRLDRYAKVSAQKLYKKQLWKNNKQEFNYEPHFNPHHEDKNAYQLNETREQEVQKPQLNQHHEDKNAYQLNKIQEQEVQEPQFDQHLEHQQEYYAEVEESSHTITEKPLSCEKKKKHVSWSDGYEASEISLDFYSSTDSSATAVSGHHWIPSKADCLNRLLDQTLLTVDNINSASKRSSTDSCATVVSGHHWIPSKADCLSRLLDQTLLSPDSANCQPPVMIADVLEPWMAHFHKGPVLVKSDSWVHKKRLEMSLVPRVFTRRLKKRLLPMPTRKLNQNRPLRELVLLHEQLKEVECM